MNNTADRLYELLPAIYRIRDAKQGGHLKNLVDVIAEQVEALEENLAQSYDDHFIETCADWVIPYIGDLIGYRTLHGVAPKISSQRAEVANTIGFRRRKGTASMLEQLARDVTGWNARAVEFFELLATNQYMNHRRLHNKVTPNLRQWEPLERLGTAFDTIPRTIDVRRISTEKGKYNIPNIGIFLWRLNDYSLTQSPAFRILTNDGRFMFSPLGNNTPLFTSPETENEVTHIAEPINVPEPISRRVLNNYLEDYYGKGNSMVLHIGIGDDSDIDSSQIAICNLSDIEEQRIVITGHTDGQYTLSFQGDGTAEIDHDASPADIQAALEGLGTLAVGDITVAGIVAASEINVIVRFNNVAPNVTYPLISVNASDLNPAGEVVSMVIKNWAHPPLDKIAIDPVLARIAIPLNKPQHIQIQGHSAGQYALGFDGNEVLVNHNATIEELRIIFSELSNLSEADIMIKGSVTETEIDFVVAFGGVLSGEDVPLVTVDEVGLNPAATKSVTELEWIGSIGDDLRVEFRYGFSADMGGGEYERQSTFHKKLDVIAGISDGDSIQNVLASAAESGAVEINSSGRFDEVLFVDLNASQKLELRAGNGNRSCILLNDALEITGEEKSELFINGLLITGAGIVIPFNNNSISKVTLRHCTLVPGLTLSIDGEPLYPAVPSLIVEAENVTVVIDHCIIGGIRTGRGTTIEINDSFVDATVPTNLAFGPLGENDDGPGGILEIINSTVIGQVFAAAISLASNVIFLSETLGENEAPVRAADKQTGCVRFSYVPPGSIVPRRYRCQPDLAVREAIAVFEKKQIVLNSEQQISEQQKAHITNGVQARVRPGFRDLRYGRPAYGQLRPSTPIEIRTGADDESEMGAFHQLYQLQRETNLRVRLDEYLRFGLEAGIFYAN